jgi:hypothetical protein
MLNSRPQISLLLASGIALAGFACSSGGTEQTTIKVDPTAGTGSSMGGSGNSAGSGMTIPTAGTPATGGADSGQAGSQAAAGSGAVGGSLGGTGSNGGAGGVTSGGSGGAGGTGGGEPNKVVLFDGTPETFKSWASVRDGSKDNPWTNNGDGSMTVKTNTGDIISKQKFQNAFVHLEYKTPKITSAGGGQERGNSGVYLKGSYEMQVLDTYGLPPAIDGCGALYSIKAPLVVACKKEDEWNTYEIEFKANVCTNGAKTANAEFVDVKLNGMQVQKNVVADHFTQAGQAESCDPKGLMLQDHSSILPVSFRNIWVIPRD